MKIPSNAFRADVLAGKMPSPLISKLEHSGFLTDVDRETLTSLVRRSRRVPKSKDLIREGDRPNNVIVVLEGFACRYKMMPPARRHIMALLVPGDFCDLHVAILQQMDHGISTLTSCEIAEIPRATIEELTTHHPSLTRALWWATLTDEGTLREWLANMGQRGADRQMAHLFCELLIRLQAVDHATHNSYEFPLTQSDLGDVLGLSNVHVNRTLQELRDQNLVVLDRRQLSVPDVERLKTYCGFNPNYLHLRPQMKGSSPIEIS